jgi:acetyl-CoA carboxylase biotin carboxyl carrier protein
METKEIQKLIDFIAQSGLDEVNIETSELKLAIKRFGAAPVVQQVVAAAPVAVAAPAVAAPAPAAAPVAAAPAPVASNRVTIKSPMIGTFYYETFQRNRIRSIWSYC